MATPITIAYGDGIGPEIMEATLHILREAGAQLNIETIEVGERIYNQGATSGILPSAWESLRRTKVLLKAPITTPQGGGFKSLNVTMRKTLGLYANVRPVVSYYPFVEDAPQKMDLVIVRENEEDLYAGIEHRQSEDVYQCLKILTRSGTERIVRYAFDYAMKHNRRKVTCMTKDNIMKLADGMFHNVFDEIGAEYPHLEKEHFIVDIGSARIASKPEHFDIIVTLNLYGDIISDIAAEVSGSVGLAGSANIGQNFAMFEAIHGSAPDIAGKNIANPSGLLHGAILMLVHIGQPEAATFAHNAWLATLEDGIHTGDIAGEHTKEKVGTKEFAEAVVARIGKKPKLLNPVAYVANNRSIKTTSRQTVIGKKELVGVDMFVDWRQDVNELGKTLQSLDMGALRLTALTNKGLKTWPGVNTTDMHLTDQYCCRFSVDVGRTTTHEAIANLLTSATAKGLDFTKIENLYHFDGERGYSLGQGE